VNAGAGFDRSVPRFQRIAVLGLGLIGGSVAAAARARGVAGEVVGYAPGADAALALELGLLDRMAESAAQAVDGVDLVVLAAPIPAMPGLFDEIAANLGDQALLTDVASTKRSTIAAARSALGSRFARFVAAHPIAGGERHGPRAARPDLFESCLTLLCPQAETDSQALEGVQDFWTSLGARVSQMDAQDHDQVFAEVSHWPHAAVFALCAAIARGSRAEDALRFAGAGLRDTTRIGASSASLWADIVLDNRDAVLECARLFEDQLRSIIAALEQQDRQALVDTFGVAAEWRARLPAPPR